MPEPNELDQPDTPANRRSSACSTADSLGSTLHSIREASGDGWSNVADVDAELRDIRGRTVSRKEIELELDAAIGSPIKAAGARAKLEAMDLSRDEAIMQGFRNGLCLGIVLSIATCSIIALISTLL